MRRRKVRAEIFVSDHVLQGPAQRVAIERDTSAVGVEMFDVLLHGGLAVLIEDGWQRSAQFWASPLARIMHQA